MSLTALALGAALGGGGGSSSQSEAINNNTVSNSFNPTISVNGSPDISNSGGVEASPANTVSQSQQQPSSGGFGSFGLPGSAAATAAPIDIGGGGNNALIFGALAVGLGLIFFLNR